MSVKAIPYPYRKADRTLLDKIERDRPVHDGILAEWWRVGSLICTSFDNGYYHCYRLERDPFYGRVFRDYRIDKYGKMVETNKFYRVSTKADAIEWLTERGINIEEV